MCKIKGFKNIICLMLICVMITGLVGCKKSFSQSGDLLAGMSVQEVADREADEIFKDSQMRLSVDLFKKIFNSEKSAVENVLVSPLSIQLALAMTANGADGQTKLEMERLLGGELTIEELNGYLHTYINDLPSSDKSKFSFANSIWIRDGAFNVEKPFLQTNLDYYNSQVYKEPINLQTVEKMNSWVEQNTDGMIKKIIESLSSNDMMVLINALAFDAEWGKKYDKQLVTAGEFTNIQGEVQKVEMMNSTEYKYIEDDDVTGFVKDYHGGAYSFVAMLPTEGVSLYDYVDGLSGEKVKSLLANVQKGSVQTAMPKFSSEYDLELGSILAELGMKDAFDSARADFSKIEKSKSLYIGEVIHKTFISVDEAGTKAGAATAVIMKNAAMSPKWQVRLNRPFVYMIIDNSSNLPIFIGTVVDLQ